jgi:hypothetical protein
MEGVAVRQCRDAFKARRMGCSTEDRRYLRLDFSGAEGSQADMIERSMALEIREDRPQRMAATEFVRAIREDEQHTRSHEPSSEEQDNVKARAIGPLEVVDDRNDGALRGGSRKQVTDPEEGGGSTGGRRPDVVPHGGRMHAAQRPADCGGLGFDVRAQIPDSIEQLDQWQVSEASADVDAAPAEPGGHLLGWRVVVKGSLELHEQAALTDPSFTRDKNDAAWRFTSPSDGVAEAPELITPSDQSRAGASGHARHGAPVGPPVSTPLITIPTDSTTGYPINAAEAQRPRDLPGRWLQSGGRDQRCPAARPGHWDLVGPATPELVSRPRARGIRAGRAW